MLNTEQLLHEKVQFWKHGYTVVRRVFTKEEMAIVKQKIMAISEMNTIVKNLRGRQATGAHPSFETILVWNDVDGEDLFAKVGKSYKILDRLSYYYEDDVYDYHNKIALKYPGIVGFRPHQDHYYWKGYGCSFPEGSAVFIAIDESTKENGCLKIMAGSHLLGTLPHGSWSETSSDNGVKPSLIKNLQELGYDLKPIEMESGDIVLFHGNTIHGSDDNHSTKTRIAMIATMNTKKNSPIPEYNAPGHPYWTAQKRVFEAITEEDLSLPLPDFKKRFSGFDPVKYKEIRPEFDIEKYWQKRLLNQTN